MSIHTRYWKGMPKDIVGLKSIADDVEGSSLMRLIEIETYGKFCSLVKSPMFLIPLMLSIGGLVSAVPAFALSTSIGISILAISVVCVIMAVGALGLTAIIVALQWTVGVSYAIQRISYETFEEITRELDLTPEEADEYSARLFTHPTQKIKTIMKQVEDEFTGNEYE